MSQQPSRLRRLRKIVVTILGVAIVLFGLILMVFPGPGLVVAALGLALLGLEYGWAKRMASWMRGMIDRFLRREKESASKD